MLQSFVLKSYYMFIKMLDETKKNCPQNNTKCVFLSEMASIVSLSPFTFFNTLNWELNLSPWASTIALILAISSIKFAISSLKLATLAFFTLGSNIKRLFFRTITTS